MSENMPRCLIGMEARVGASPFQDCRVLRPRLDLTLRWSKPDANFRSLWGGKLLPAEVKGQKSIKVVSKTPSLLGGTDGSNPLSSSEESCERWSPLRRSSATRSPRRTYFGSMVQRGLITCAYCRCERALSKWGVTSGPPDVSQYGWSPPITVTGWAIAGAPLLLALGFAASWVISGFKRE